jgi:hypothetical protein
LNVLGAAARIVAATTGYDRVLPSPTRCRVRQRAQQRGLICIARLERKTLPSLIARQRSLALRIHRNGAVE